MSSLIMSKDTTSKTFSFSETGGNKSVVMTRDTTAKTFQFLTGLLTSVSLPFPSDDGQIMTLDIDQTIKTISPTWNIRAGLFTVSKGANTIPLSSNFPSTSYKVFMNDFGLGCRDPYDLAVGSFKVNSLKPGTVWYIAILNA